jgi:hypothetical protein
MLLCSNNAVSTLLNPFVTGATALTIQTADANKFPQPVAADDYFMATLEDRTQNPVVREIVKVTGRVGSVFTVVRAQEGTVSPASFAAGVIVSNRITAGTIQGLAETSGASTQLYLGAFATAPTTTNAGTSLVAGLLYFNTTLGQMFEYGPAGWVAISVGTGTTSAGQYIGAYAVAPSTRIGGGALQSGDLYYNTVAPGQLYEYIAGAWAPATASTTITGSTTVGGNLTVDGNLTVTGSTSLETGLNVTGGATVDDLDATDGTFTSLTVIDLASVGSLDIGGQPVVTAGNLSGTAFSQNWPNGNIEKWGSATTSGSGQTTVTFATPFPSAITNVQLTVAGTSTSGGNEILVFNKTVNGFSVSTGSGGTPYGPVAFDWTAKGN